MLMNGQQLITSTDTVMILNPNPNPLLTIEGIVIRKSILKNLIKN